MKAYFVPHPPLLVRGVGEGYEIPDTRKAYAKIGKEIEKINPDTVVVISPHSVLYEDFFFIASGKTAMGDFGSFGAKKTKISVKQDAEFAKLIEQFARDEGLMAGSLGEEIPVLDHGITVPLCLFKEQQKTVSEDKLFKYPIVRISLSGCSFLEHYKLGRAIAKVGQELNRKFVIIASGDMSHKLSVDGPYGFAKEGPEFDKLVCELVKSGDVRKLLSIDPAFCERAGECGFRSLVMLLGAFDGLELKTEVLSYQGPFGVGYLTASFESVGKSKSLLETLVADENNRLRKIRDSEDEYVRLARLVIEYHVHTGKIPECPKSLSAELLNKRAGVFVSIKKDGRLRGCIGTTGPTTKNIAEEILQNALSAAFDDPRFDPIEIVELDSLVYSVDVLTPSERIKDKSQLDVKRYGVIVRSGRKSGLLLPALEGVDTVDEQVEIALRKAGIGAGELYTLERFEVIRHK